MIFILLAIQIMLLGQPARADDPLSRYVDHGSMEKLRTGASISASVSSDGMLRLVPSIGSRDSLAAEVKALHLTVGVEFLRLIPGQPGAESGNGWLKVYNTMHAVSSMKGITYYSVTRGKVEVLFTQSYALSSADAPVRIDDPVFDEIPNEDVLYTFQEDRSFGGNRYQERFWFRTDHLIARIENLSTIFLFMLPLIQPHNLVSHVAIVPVDGDLLFYGVACIRSAMPIGNRHSREESLANRLIAMADWLASRLSAARRP
jgi:hypothetical protein